MAEKPCVYDSVEAMVEDTIARVGKDIVLAMPIGAGQPLVISNEFYRRAVEDPSISLRLLTGLSLEIPASGDGLRQRFMDPIVRRLYPDFPVAQYLRDAREGRLPDNVVIQEYYLRPGGFLHVPHIQQNYTSSNYSMIARDMAMMKPNVAAAIISKKEIDGRLWYSISSNASASLDLMKKMIERQNAGENIELLGHVNSNMPFMFGGAMQAPSVADRVLDASKYNHVVFGPPREAIGTREYFIGMYASALVRDAGTIQIGIGSLGDAIGYCLNMRRHDNETYHELLNGVGALDRFGTTIAANGGTDTLPHGLYGSTEMLTDPFVQLMESGIISREVYDDYHIQSLVDEGLCGGEVSAALIDGLIDNGGLHNRITEKEFRWLQEFGIFRADLSFSDGVISGNDFSVRADLLDPENRKIILHHCLGRRLRNGYLIHAGFFMGPPSFYDALMTMPDEQRRKINMREISYVNQLYGGEDLKRLQRRNARFFNTTMMVTALGAATSDTLDDGQVVSGVGGQYNFVTMGHALEDARSVIMVRSTRKSSRGEFSNFVWNYANATVPRHLRDVFISEYGIADVRGLPDKEVIAALINICDSRFQGELLAQAVRNGKMPPDYKIPDGFRNNFPERLETEIARFRDRGLFEEFPYGSELTEVEIALSKAMAYMAGTGNGSSENGVAEKKDESAAGNGKVPAAAAKFLERLDLLEPQTEAERVQRKQLVSALSSTGAIEVAGHRE